jgi:hypothetical protein
MVFNELKKYLNGKIYKITNTVNDEIYIGSTYHHLIKRWGQHISYTYDNDNIHKPLYKMIREYGYEMFNIELIKDFPCISRKQLEIEELTYIKQHGTLNIRGNDNIKTIYNRNKYDGSKLRLCSNIKSISNEILNNINKEFSRELDIYKNMTNISSITINKNKETIHDLYELYCKTLNIKGLRKESSKKPKSKLAFLLENVLSLTLDDKIKRGVRCSDKILTFYEYQITRCV